MKKILSTLLALVMAMSISTAAFATDANPTYSYNEKTGELILYSNYGYEDLANDYMKQNNISEEDLGFEYALLHTLESVKTIRFGKDVDFVLGSDAFENLEKIEVDEDNPYLCVFDKALYSKDKTRLLAYPYASDDIDVYIPSECTEVFGDYGVFTYFRRTVTNGKFIVTLRPLKKYNLYFMDPTGENVSDMVGHNPGPIYSVAGIYVANEKNLNNLNLNFYGGKKDIDIFLIDLIDEYYRADGDALYLDKFDEFFEENEQYSERWDKLDDEERIVRDRYDNFWDSIYEYGNPAFDEYLEIIDKYTELFHYALTECGLMDVIKQYENLNEVSEYWANLPTDIAKVYDSSITIETSADTVDKGQNITFTSDVKMPEGEITWYVDGAEAGSGETFTIENAEVGTHTVKAVVTFPGGTTSESNEVSVTVAKQTFVQRVAEFFRNISTFFTSIFAKIVGIFG